MTSWMQSVGGVLFVAVALAACGGSKKNGSSGSTNKADGGGSGSGGNGASGSGGNGGSKDGGVGPSGAGEEGAPCDSTHMCKGKLACVESIFTVGVCGRGCTTATDCMTDEVCFSYSGLQKDGHCVNLVKDEYAVCGVADTSVCDNNRPCLYLQGEAIGVCVDTCALNGSSASGDDGGVGGAGAAPPPGAVMCAGKETCVDGVLADGVANEGVCGTMAKRGEPCDSQKGIYCPPTDICAPKDPNDLTSEERCFQDCSATSTKCDTGKCLVVQNQGQPLFAYCM